MIFFTLYQYLAPALLLPFSYYLWLNRLGGSHRLALLALSMPILTAYIIPGLGTNRLKLWTFNTRLKLGHFTPQHGFIFGSAISLLAFVVVDAPPLRLTPGLLLRTALISGSTIAFWNWLFDIVAIKTGYIVVFNQPFAQNRGPEAIATDYAPVYFGLFGACYGFVLHLSQYYLLPPGRADLFWPMLLLGNGLVLTVPSLGFVVSSWLRHGHTGLTPFPAPSQNSGEHL